jgi:hypothetical protein
MLPVLAYAREQLQDLQPQIYPVLQDLQPQIYPGTATGSTASNISGNSYRIYSLKYIREQLHWQSPSSRENRIE